jgi:hypothetical protein
LTADDAFEVFVKPYEQVLHAMGFKHAIDHELYKTTNISTWHMKIDPEKYDGDAMAVQINDNNIIITGGSSAFSHTGDVYQWTYHLKQLPATRLRSTITSHLWEMEKTVAKVARQLLAMAKEMTSAQVNALNGLKSQVAKRYVNKILGEHSKGIFSDQSWEGINKIWKALDDNGIVYTMTGAEYQKDNQSGMPVRKQWKFEVEFWNEKGERGRMVKLYGVVIASGAGTVEDPLSRYDIIAYVS